PGLGHWLARRGLQCPFGRPRHRQALHLPADCAGGLSRSHRPDRSGAALRREAQRRRRLEDLMLDFTQVLVHWPLFLEGLQNTIVICVVSFLAGGLLAVPIALLRVYNVAVLSQIAGFYIYLFRGTPLLIQTYLIYFG